jgi:gamma-glutamylcyclotransferase (GGCT)/AIG2-like uncharacterized protein YtfP
VRPGGGGLYERVVVEVTTGAGERVAACVYTMAASARRGQPIPSGDWAVQLAEDRGRRA